MSGGATVELVWIEKQIEHWIRFGRIVRTTIQSRSRSTVAFDPGAVFAFVRWQANDFGTAKSRIDILRAPRPGESYATVPQVTPGGDSLLRQSGWPKVERVLQFADAIEALGIDPADASQTGTLTGGGVKVGAPDEGLWELEIRTGRRLHRRHGHHGSKRADG